LSCKIKDPATGIMGEIDIKSAYQITGFFIRNRIIPVFATIRTNELRLFHNGPPITGKYIGPL
jgi:hypothetical protein